MTSRATSPLRPNDAEIPFPQNPWVRRAIQKHATSGSSDHVWNLLEARRRTVIEPVTIGDETWHRITFLHRADPTEVGAVAIRSWLFEWDAQGQMHHVPDTDVWWLEAVVPPGFEGEYGFRTHRSGPGWSDPTPDPSNARTTAWGYTNPFHDRLRPAVSVVRAPGGRRPKHGLEPLSMPMRSVLSSGHLVDDGELFSDLRTSKLPHRRIRTYRPPRSLQATDEKSLPVLIFLDGEQAVEMCRAPQLLDTMIRGKQIPPVLAVFVDSNVTGQDPTLKATLDARRKEMACSDDFTDFLVDEVLPHARNLVPGTGAAPQDVTVVGFSNGGLAAGFAALSRPEVIGNALMLSPSMWWPGSLTDEAPEALLRMVTDGRVTPKDYQRLLFAVGYLEQRSVVAGDHRTGIYASTARLVRAVANLPPSSRPWVSSIVFPGAHDTGWWQRCMQQPLAALLNAGSKRFHSSPSALVPTLASMGAPAWGDAGGPFAPDFLDDVVVTAPTRKPVAHWQL